MTTAHIIRGADEDRLNSLVRSGLRQQLEKSNLQNRDGLQSWLDKENPSWLDLCGWLRNMDDRRFNKLFPSTDLGNEEWTDRLFNWWATAVVLAENSDTSLSIPICVLPDNEQSGVRQISGAQSLPIPPKEGVLASIRKAVETRHVLFIPKTQFPENSWFNLILFAWLCWEEKEIKKEEKSKRDLPVPMVVRPVYKSMVKQPRSLVSIGTIGDELILNSELVEINGERHMKEPNFREGIVTASPRPFGIVPGNKIGGATHSQLSLALNLENHNAIEQAVITATYKFPALTAKLIPIMLGISPDSISRTVKGTLGELTALVYPEGTRKLKANRKRVFEAFSKVSSLYFIEEYDGRRRGFQMFNDTEFDLSVIDPFDPTTGLKWRLSQRVVDLMYPGQQGGWFPLNMDRWRELSCKKTRIFSLALRCAAIHDQCRQNGFYHEDKAKFISAIMLAGECNRLSPIASEFLCRNHSGKSGQRMVRKAIDSLEADLSYLQRMGMTRFEKRGKASSLMVKILAPDGYSETVQKMKSDLARTKKISKQD